MMEFRIIKQYWTSAESIDRATDHYDYIVQRKFLWWWITDRSILPGGSADLLLTSISRFSTIEKARDYIENNRPKSQGESEVVERRIIW